MNVKTSKEVTDRQKACLFLLSVFSLQGPPVATSLTELFGRQFKDGEEPDYASHILGFARLLQEALAGLVAADEAHYAEKAQHAALRKRRNELTRDLTRRIVALRRAVVGLHAEPDLSRLGFEAETARDAVPLLRQADRIAETLAKGDLEALLGAPVFDHMRFDPQGIPEQLKQAAEALRAVVAKIGEVERRVEAALLRKRTVRSEYDQLFLRAARIFENCCHLTGHTELAARVRRSRSRSAQTEREPAPEASGEVPHEAPDGGVAEEPFPEPKQGAPELRPPASAEGAERTAGGLGQGFSGVGRRPLYTDALNRGGRAPPSEAGGTAAAKSLAPGALEAGPWTDRRGRGGKGAVT